MKPDAQLFYIHSSSSRKGLMVRLPRFVLIVLICVAVGGGLGLLNCIRSLLSYTYAKFSVYTQVRQNQQLTMKLRFLGKLTEQKTKEMRQLAQFEDVARLKYGMAAVSEDVRKAGVGGKPSMEEEILASLEDPLLKSAGKIQQNLEALIRQTIVEDSTFSRLSNHVGRQNERWLQRPSMWPAHGKLTSEYGLRYHPVYGHVIFHEGLDIASKEWTPVFASARGLVTAAGPQHDYGNVVVMNHDGGGYVTRYAHLVQTAVKSGQLVNRGDVIGYVGNTGLSTGPHLHYEVLEMGKHQDPLHYILPTDVIVD
jgi:murein DD-endopeptidase MepM/ murein hydrolase activator NlpD